MEDMELKLPTNSPLCNGGYGPLDALSTRPFTASPLPSRCY
jgi:hypothetical protein